MPGQLKKGHKRVCTVIPEELLEELEQVAQIKGIKRQEAVIEALRKWIDFS